VTVTQDAALLERTARFASSAGWLTRRSLRGEAERFVPYGALRDLFGDDVELGDHDTSVALTARVVVDHCITLCRERPLALFVEHAHWADRSSLKVLVHLARWTSVMPLLMVLVADGDATPDVAALFA
jgi:hypothetical protein